MARSSSIRVPKKSAASRQRWILWPGQSLPGLFRDALQPPVHGLGHVERSRVLAGFDLGAELRRPRSVCDHGYGPTAQTGAYVSFSTSTQRTVEARIAISFVSVEGARRNLDTEIGQRGFGAVRQGTRSEWDRTLGAIEVSGGLESDRRTFYSMLYRALLSPSTFNDVDGRYMGMDGEVHTAAGYTQHADFSGWDVYRSQLPLLGLLFPQRASDVVSSLLANQRESGWLPRWTVANGHTNVMVGDPAAPAIASILALGGRGFDLDAALAALVKGATQSGVSANGGYVQREALDDYLRLGYVPHERNADATAANTEPAGGWRLPPTRRPATSPGDRQRRRSNTRSPISRSPRWLQPPARLRSAPSSSSARGIGSTSSTPQSATYAPAGPTAASSIPSSQTQTRPEAAAASLRAAPPSTRGWFRTIRLGCSRPSAAAAARRSAGQLLLRLNAGDDSGRAYLGNEPSLGTPWLYDWLGQPYRTQRVVRSAILSLYNGAPGGYPGNDDLGQLSAWYVFGALGLYPAIPGTDILALASPLFPRTTVHLPGGDLSLLAPNAGRAKPFVQGLRLNGEPHGAPWLSLSEVAAGATLRFRLGPEPNRRWGGGRAATPPSFGPHDVETCGD